MADQRNALISVYNKEGIVEFAKGLVKNGFTIFASGGTAKKLEQSNVKVKDVSELVGGEAILGHRVVTLSREIFAGILADTSSKADMKELKELNIPLIDLVCVDMYPLEEELAKKDVNMKDVITQTDIGGPTLLRAAAKGRRIVLSVAEQRPLVIDWLSKGMPSKDDFVQDLAARAEYEVTRYTLALAKYMGSSDVSGGIARRKVTTKYGENPQQQDAGFYADNRINIDPLGLDRFELVKGMQPSFINYTDIDRLLQTITHIAAGYDVNFNDIPAIAVGVKHGNACGAAVANTHKEAVQKMLMGDTRAIFGGVVMINGEITKEVADALVHFAMDDGSTRLLDGVIGASVSSEALQILGRKKLRVMVNPALANLNKDSLDNKRRVRPVRGGYLEQPNYTFVFDLQNKDVQHFGKVSKKQEKDAILAWAIGCTSNSNTITLVKDGMLLGNGVGQQDRVGAGQLSLTRTNNTMPDYNAKTMELTIKLDNKKISGCVAYSDSFFPFADGPELLAKAGAGVIITSSGSVADESVFATINSYDTSVIAMSDKLCRGFYMH